MEFIKRKHTLLIIIVFLLLVGANVYQAFTKKTEVIVQTKYETKEVEVKKVIVQKVPVKEIVEVEKESTPVFDISSVDRELIARCVYREGGGESIECQELIASVIFNRLKSGYWGNDFYDVVYSPNQFAVAPLLWETTPSEEAYEAVDEIIWNGSKMPEYVLYFRADHHFNGDGYIGYCDIDNVYFGYYLKDVNGG